MEPTRVWTEDEPFEKTNAQQEEESRIRDAFNRKDKSEKVYDAVKAKIALSTPLRYKNNSYSSQIGAIDSKKSVSNSKKFDFYCLFLSSALYNVISIFHC